MCSIYCANSAWASMHSFTRLPGTEPMTDHSNPTKLHSSMPGLQGHKAPDSLYSASRLHLAQKSSNDLAARTHSQQCDPQCSQQNWDGLFAHTVFCPSTTRKDPNMDSWIYVVQANQTSHFTKTRTLCDFPLLIGEILRRADLRLRRQARRRARVRKIGAAFGIR
jgi:hypothetical protein